jgi:hypothetical protein
VIIQTQTGTATVNALYFKARTADGTNIDAALGAVDNGLTFGEVPQGQKLRGPVAFDVPPGHVITQIVLTGPLGSQDGLWTVG